MCHLCVKAQTAKHTGKLVIHHKAINRRSLAIEDYIKRFARMFGNACSVGKPVTRATGNNAEVYPFIHKTTHNLAYSTITACNNYVGDLLFMNNWLQK